MRLRHNGKQITKSMETWISDSAVKVAKGLLQAQLEGRLQSVLDVIQPKVKQAPPVEPECSVGDIAQAYRQAPGHANAATRRAGLSALKRVIELALGTEPAWTVRTLSELNDELVIRFREAKESSVEDESAGALVRARNGGRSMLRQARAIFTDELVDHYRRRAGLAVPSMEKFRSTPGFSMGSRKKDYQEPADWLLRKTFTELEATRETHPDRYLACWLALGFGLRKSEISAARTDWFIEKNGCRYLELRAVSCWTTYRATNIDKVTTPRMSYGERDITKNGQINPQIPEANGAWERIGAMLEGMAPGNYIIGGSLTWRLDGVFRETNEWLRQLGWKTQKGIHELRAYAGCQVILENGILNGSLWLRHGDIGTTQQYYGRYLTMSVKNVPLFAAPAASTKDGTGARKGAWSSGVVTSPTATHIATHVVPAPKMGRKSAPTMDFTVTRIATQIVTHAESKCALNSIEVAGDFGQYINSERTLSDSNTTIYTFKSL
jgi:integrase